MRPETIDWIGDLAKYVLDVGLTAEPGAAPDPVLTTARPGFGPGNVAGDVRPGYAVSVARWKTEIRTKNLKLPWCRRRCFVAL
jgi:hypothetical protein